MVISSDGCWSMRLNEERKTCKKLEKVVEGKE